MIKFLIALLLLIFTLDIHAAPAGIFKGTFMKLLPKDGIEFKDDKKIISGTDDPSSTATDANQGSLFVYSSNLFQKQDNGSTTNWLSVLTGTAGLGTDDCVPRWDGTSSPTLQDSIFCITDLGVGTGLTQLNVDNLRLDGNTLSSTDTNGSLIISPDGTGNVNFPGLTASTGLILNSSKDLTSLPMTDGQVIIGSTAGDPVAATITGTADQVNVANGSGSITLSTPQDIATTSSPSFSGLTISGLTEDSIPYIGAGGVLSEENGLLAWDAGTNVMTVNDFTFHDDLIKMTAGSQMWIEAGTTTTPTVVALASLDAAATDDSTFRVYGTGNSSATTNTEYMLMGWDTAQGVYEIDTDSTGTGSDLPLVLSSASNANQIYLDTTGNVGILKAPSGSALDVQGFIKTSQTGAQRVVVTDASNRIETGAVTVTELNYLSGVTSSVQTQLDAKAETLQDAYDNDVTSPQILLSASNDELVFQESNNANANNTILDVKKADAASVVRVKNNSFEVFQNLNLPNVTASQPLKLDASNNVTSGDIDLTSEVTGILPAANGGSGLDGSAAANGELLIGNGTGYTLSTLTGTTNQVDVANGAGSVTLSTPQDIHTGASPTFVGATLSGLTQGSVLFSGSGGLVSQDNASFFFDDTANELSIGNLNLSGNQIGTDSGDIDLLPTGTNDLAFKLSSGQAYNWNIRGTNPLTLQGQSTGAASQLELFSNDGDGTDSTALRVFGQGTPSSVQSGTDGEYLEGWWNSADSVYEVSSKAAGSGTQRALELKAGTDDQLVLATDGTISAASTVTASNGLLRALGDMSLQSNTMDDGGFERGVGDITCTQGASIARVTSGVRKGFGSGMAQITGDNADPIICDYKFTDANLDAGTNGFVTCHFKSASITDLEYCSLVGDAERDCVDYDDSGEWRRPNNLGITLPLSGTDDGFRFKTTAATSDTIEVDNCYGGVLPAGVIDHSAAISKEESVTVDGAWTTNTTYTAKKRQVGNHFEYQVKVELSNAPNSATLTVNLPSGDEMDTASMAATNGGSAPTVIPGSWGSVVDPGNNTYPAVVTFVDSTTVGIKVINAGGTYGFGANVTETVPITFASNDVVSLGFSVPILNLGGTVDSISAASDFVSFEGFWDDGSGTACGPALGTTNDASFQDVSGGGNCDQVNTLSGSGVTMSTSDIAASANVTSGSYRACFKFSHQINITGGRVFQFFRMSYCDSSGSCSGGSPQNAVKGFRSRLRDTDSSFSNEDNRQISICHILDLDKSDEWTFQLQENTSSVASTIDSNSIPVGGDGGIFFSLERISENANLSLNDMVKTPGSGALQSILASAIVTDGTSTTTVTKDASDIVDGDCTNNDLGEYVCTLKDFASSGDLDTSCWAQIGNTSNRLAPFRTAQSTNSVTYVFRDTSNNRTDVVEFELFCKGYR